MGIYDARSSTMRDWRVACERCQKELPPGRWKYCSDRCADVDRNYRYYHTFKGREKQRAAQKRQYRRKHPVVKMMRDENGQWCKVDRISLDALPALLEKNDFDCSPEGVVTAKETSRIMTKKSQNRENRL